MAAAEGTVVVPHFRFGIAEFLPYLKSHYLTLGKLYRDAGSELTVIVREHRFARLYCASASRRTVAPFCLDSPGPLGFFPSVRRICPRADKFLAGIGIADACRAGQPMDDHRRHGGFAQLQIRRRRVAARA